MRNINNLENTLQIARNNDRRNFNRLRNVSGVAILGSCAVTVYGLGSDSSALLSIGILSSAVICSCSSGLLYLLDKEARRNILAVDRTPPTILPIVDNVVGVPVQINNVGLDSLAQGMGRYSNTIRPNSAIWQPQTVNISQQQGLDVGSIVSL